LRGSEKGSKTLEELQMENQALKHLSDTLSKRLHMWEVNAQSSSMALQQSLKAIHAASPTASAVPSTPLSGTSSNEARIKELEDRLRRGEKELERANRENEKLKEVLGRYRDRWEKLKEGAKTRREANFAAASPSPRADEPDATPKLTAAEGGSSEDT
jgi:TolA-binding protein